MRNILITIGLSLILVVPILAQNQDEVVYVVSPTTDAVFAIDPATEEIIETIPVGSRPTSIATNSSTGTAYVVNSGDDSISVIEDNEVTSTIELEATPANLQVDEENNQIIITFAGTSETQTLDGETLEIVENTDSSPPAPQRPPESSTRPVPERVRELLLPSYPLCPQDAGANLETFQTNLTPGLIDVQCRILAANTEFVQPAAEIGVQSVLDREVIHAVELFSPSSANFERIDVCLSGNGYLIYLDAEDQPREPVWLQRTVRSGYVCTQIPGPGTLILVR